MYKFFLVISLSLIVAATHCPVQAGPALDEYLNNMRMGPHAKGRGEPVSVTNDAPVGQTFTTGNDTARVCRIAVVLPWTEEEWGKDESLVMCVYDSPEKASQLARFSMKHEWRAFEEQLIVYPVEFQALPNTTYYFELSVDGGNGRIDGLLKSSGDYPNGQMFIGGKPAEGDLYFEVYDKPPFDRDALYSRAFEGFNLDYPALSKVKAAVLIKDWETAVRELIAHFEGRTDLIPPKEKRKPVRIKDFKDREIELNAEQKLTDANGDIVDLGPNWNHLRWWSTRGGVGLTRGGLRKPFATAYVATGDEKYAIAFNSMLQAFFTELPSPIKAGVIPPDAKDILPINGGGIRGGTMWSGLALAARCAHEFAYYKRFVDSPNFEPDTRAMFIFNFVDMAQMLSIQKAGGNWTTQMTDTLYQFGGTFPEFKDSPKWFAKGYEELLNNIRETVRDDGPVGESMGYITFTQGRFGSLIEDAARFNLRVPEDIRNKIERGYQFLMYVIQPDGNCPPWGDGNEYDIRGMVGDGARRFNRPDMLWVSTKGRQGNKPDETSFAFPISKFFVMRSDWTPDARYLISRNGRYTAHGHSDSLSLIVHAYGAKLIADPGIYIYGTPQVFKQMETRSHSTISVNGSDTHNNQGDCKWVSSSFRDYLDMVGPGFKNQPGVVSRRRIMFVKPDYWVLSDLVTGPADNDYLVESRFRFAGGTAAEILSSSVLSARTLNKKGGNISVIVPNPSGFHAKMEDGEESAERETLVPAKLLNLHSQTRLPVRLETVLYPYKGAKSPNVEVISLNSSGKAPAEAGAVRVKTKKGTDIIVFGADDGSVIEYEGGITAACQSALISLDSRGRITKFSAAGARLLKMGDIVLLESADRMESLDVSYSKGIADVVLKGETSTASIALIGAKKAVVNKKEIKTQGIDTLPLNNH